MLIVEVGTKKAGDGGGVRRIDACAALRFQFAWMPGRRLLDRRHDVQAARRFGVDRGIGTKLGSASTRSSQLRTSG